MAGQPNFHASAVVVGDRGLLVSGASGSGKTALCLALLHRCRASGMFARLVSDDQVLLSRAANRLVARAPVPIAGLIEVRGFQPAPIEHLPAMVVDLLVRLVPDEEAPRFSGGETAVLEGCRIPCLELPARGAHLGVSTLWAWLQLPPFGPREVPISAR